MYTYMGLPRNAYHPRMTPQRVKPLTLRGPAFAVAPGDAFCGERNGALSNNAARLEF